MPIYPIYSGHTSPVWNWLWMVCLCPVLCFFAVRRRDRCYKFWAEDHGKRWGTLGAVLWCLVALRNSLSRCYWPYCSRSWMQLTIIWLHTLSPFMRNISCCLKWSFYYYFPMCIMWMCLYSTQLGSLSALLDALCLSLSLSLIHTWWIDVV